jgi:transcriptional regulator with XRE-family HTH domain
VLTKHHRRQLRQVQPTDAARLRFAMAKALLTQEALERQSGVTQSTISKILTGQRRELSIANAIKLARVFGIAVEDLFPSTIADVQT